jgi:hypothetical protein
MKTFKFLYILGLICLSPAALFSASPPPSGTPLCWPPPCVPIDNGIIFLIIAGGLYGMKKIYDLRKKSETIS